MAREQGTFTQSANYELQKEGTIDARQFVDVFADLLNFTASNYIAEGFPVTVRQDSTYEGNTYKKGWYQFLGGALNNKANWEFMGGSEVPPFDPTDLEIGGRNYLPNFHSPEWNIDSGAVVDRYSLHFPANSGNPTAEIILDVESDTNYTFTFNSDYNRYYIYEYNGGVGDVIVSGSAPKTTFNTGSLTKIRLNIDTGSSNRDKDRNVSNLKLEKGTIATDWTPAPEDLVTDWDETDENSFSFLKNKPSSFPPSAHTHTISEVTGLQTALNEKADKDEIPDEFIPAEHDLDEFNNESQDPFVRSSGLPAPFDPTYLENAIQGLENTKQDNLGFIPENSENKAEALIDPDNTTYPTTKAVADAIYLTDIILSANAVLNVNWNGRDVITAGYSLTVNPNTQDYKDSFEVYLYNNSATDSAIVLTAKAGVTYTVIDNDVSSATVYLQAFGTAVIKRIGNTQNFIIRGYII